MRILALVPGGVGEQILFFPTLETLKKQYPQAAIDVVVEPRAKPAYRVYPHVSDVLTFDFRDRNGLADYLNLLGVVRDREYDIALSLGQRATIALLLWLNGIPLRIGYQNQLSWFLSRSVPLKSEQYLAYSYHDLLQALDIQSSCPELKITLPKEDIDWAEVEQKRLDIKDSGYILLCDRFSDGDSSYPTAQWQKIVQDIAQKQPNLPVVLLQDVENRAWTATMLEAFPSLKVTNPPDIGKIAAIVAGANLLVCTDSVQMQLSVAVGTYTIALFGETSAAKLLPPNSERYIGIQSPTQNLTDIQPETILKQIWRG
jgi:ADP-heptose:LPS heptosyltransferase